MKREKLTCLIALLLLLAISCTKEETNSNPSSVSSQASSDALKQASDVATDRNVAGDWILYYDWGCDGTYGITSMTLNTDGTWSSGEGFTGRWSKGVGIFVNNFDGGYSTIYTGDVYANAIRGLNTTFYGDEGCFWMKPGTSKSFKAQKDPTGMDSGGRK